MALLVTSSVQIARFANALYGVKLGSVTNAAVLEDISVVGSSNAFNSYYSSSFGSMTNAAVATTILTNLGLADNAAAQAYVEGQLNAAGSAKGAAVLSMLNAFSNLTSDETFGAAATAWNAKISTAISYTASNAADVTTDFSAPVTSQTFTLTTSVDEVKGGAGDDVISGIIGSSGTYAGGDNILGGAGTDLLKLLDDDATAAGVVSLEGVEQVNVRMLSAATTQIDASDWVGVATLSNYSSTADSTLSVSGLTIATDISVYDESNVSIDFADIATGSDTATVILNSVGSGTTSTVTVVAGGTAGVTLDATGADTLAAANLTVNGTNFLRLEGGDGLRTVTLTGTGNVHLTTDDYITSLNASALTGTNRFTLSGRSEVSVVGGAGKDTFAFGTSLNSFDVINGGDGEDTITATIGAATVRVSATAVELMTMTLGEVAGGVVDVSGANAFTTVTVGATAGASGSLINFAGATVNLADDDLTDFTIDTVANGNLTVVVGSASGAVGLTTATITDAINVTVVGKGSSTESTISELSISNTAKTVNLGASGSGSLDITTVKASGSEAITLTAGGSASLTVRSDFAATGLKTFVANATDSDAADILITGSTLFDVAATAAKLDSITLNASSGADIVIAAMEMGTSTYSASGVLNNAVTITLTAGTDSDIAGSANAVSGIDLLATGVTLTINANAGASGDILLEEIDMGDEGGASATGVMSLTINPGTIGTGGSLNIAGISGSGLPLTIGAATVGQSASFILGSAGLSLSGGTATFSPIVVEQGGTFAIGTTGAAGISGGDIGLTSGGAKVTGLDVTVGTAGAFVLAAASGTQFGAISINLQGASAEARTHTLDVNDTGTGGTIGAITVLASGAGASADIGGMSASAIGAITVTTDGSANVAFASFSGSATVGNIAITTRHTGDTVTFTNIATTAAGRIGEFNINAVGSSDVSFGDIGASAIGAITVQGSGNVTFGSASGTRLSQIDLAQQGSGGSFTIDLSAISNAVTVTGGRGTTTIVSSDGSDEFSLKTGLGTDRIVQATAIASVFDTVYRFEAGTADDRISFDISEFASGFIDTDGSGIAAADAIVFATASGAAVTLGTATIILFTTAYATTAALITDAKADITLQSAMASGEFIGVWTDGTNTFVSMINFEEESATGATADAATLVSASAVTVVTMVTIDGVTPGALVAANFSVV